MIGLDDRVGWLDWAVGLGDRPRVIGLGGLEG